MKNLKFTVLLILMMMFGLMSQAQTKWSKLLARIPTIEGNYTLTGADYNRAMKVSNEDAQKYFVSYGSSYRIFAKIPLEKGETAIIYALVDDSPSIYVAVFDKKGKRDRDRMFLLGSFFSPYSIRINEKIEMEQKDGKYYFYERYTMQNTNEKVEEKKAAIDRNGNKIAF